MIFGLLEKTSFSGPDPLLYYEQNKQKSEKLVGSCQEVMTNYFLYCYRTHRKRSNLGSRISSTKDNRLVGKRPSICKSLWATQREWQAPSQRWCPATGCHCWHFQDQGITKGQSSWSTSSRNLSPAFYTWMDKVYSLHGAVSQGHPQRELELPLCHRPWQSNYR